MSKSNRDVILPIPLALDHLTTVSLSLKLVNKNSMMSSKFSIFMS
jgi:hypothetical protein